MRANLVAKLNNISFLTPTRLEKLGGLLLMSLGSFLSPVWPMLNALMKPLMAIVFSVANPVKGYILLIAHLREMGAHDIFFQIQLPMLGLAILQLTFVILCYKLGVKLTRQALDVEQTENLEAI